MKIAIGLPFLYSEHISALALNILSLKKYCSLKYDLCILLDYSGKDKYGSFPFDEILKISSAVKIRYYPGNAFFREHKQKVVDWLVDDNYDYIFLLHSDVFLYKKNVLEKLIEPLYTHEFIASYWEVPLSLFRSTYHLSEERKKIMLIAPRVSSWMMCFDVKVYRKFLGNNQLKYNLFTGGFFIKFNSETHENYMNWIKEQKEYTNLCTFSEQCYIDISSILKYYIDIGKLKGFSMGKEKNPSFDSMEFFYREQGYVHIEQFTPARYDNILYKKELFACRENMIIEILKEQYNFIL